MYIYIYVYMYICISIGYIYYIYSYASTREVAATRRTGPVAKVAPIDGKKQGDLHSRECATSEEAATECGRFANTVIIDG